MASRAEEDKKYLARKVKHHHGKWLDEEGVIKYQKLAQRLRDSNPQLAGERRELVIQFMDEYGINELEAINILNGQRAGDYIAKYLRIRTQTPLIIKNENAKGEETGEQRSEEDKKK